MEFLSHLTLISKHINKIFFMKKIFYTILSISFFLNQENANAQAGTTDITFGNQGQITNQVYPAPAVLARAVMATADRIYTFAQVTNPISPPYDSYLKCFHLDGTVDESFGTDGLVIFPLHNGYEAAMNVDHSAIYSVGTGMVFSNAFILRFDLATQVLSLDSIIAEPNHSYLLNQISAMDDGKLMVGGFYFDVLTNIQTYRLARLLPDMTLDASYGNNGLVSMPIEITSAVNSGGFYDMEVDHLGNTYVLGNFNDTQIINKINSQGEVDLSFATAPELQASSPIRAYQDLSIALDNSLYVIPSQYMGSYPNYVIKLNGDGTLNTSFANNGIFSTQIAEPDHYINFNNIVEQPDGKVIITAHYNSLLTSFTAGKYLIKLSDAGAVDNTFQSTGNVFGFDNDDYQLWLFNSTLQPDGKVLCFDEVVHWISDVEVEYNVMLTRFLNSGVVSISENLSQEEIVLYPNPAHDFINFKSNGENITNAQIKIFDAIGKLVLSKNLQSQSLNIEDLTSGFYSIEMMSGNERSVVRFVKE